MLYKEESHGVTRMSTQFLNDSLKHCHGEVITIGGNIDESGEQSVTFNTDTGETIEVNGFSWGYMGEGPRGLFEAAQRLGFIQLTMELVGRFPQDQSWRVCKYGCIGNGLCFTKTGIGSLKIGIGSPIA